MLLVPPGQHQQLGLQLRQQVLADLLDRLRLLGVELRAGPGEDVEDRQLFLADMLAQVALLLLVEVLRQRDQLAEELLDVQATV